MTDTVHSATRDIEPPSGRFVLRLDPALHGRIRDVAGGLGISLNEYCNRVLAAPGSNGVVPATEMILRADAQFGEEAKALKPEIIELVDRILKHYVPVVLLIALAALLFWGAVWGLLAGEALWVRGVYAALAVLVMGYPCALGMATPLALIRGGGMAAERGILI